MRLPSMAMVVLLANYPVDAAGRDAQQNPPIPQARYEFADWSDQQMQRAGGDAVGWDRPENWEELDSRARALRQEICADGIFRSPESSLRLYEELHFDWGDPHTNAYWQARVNGLGLRSQFLDEQTRIACLERAVTFVQAGGGRLSPMSLADFGTVIVNAASAKDEAALRVAYLAFAEAEAWAASAGQGGPDGTGAILHSGRARAGRKKVPKAQRNARPNFHR